MYYCLSDNSFGKRGFTWARSITVPGGAMPACTECKWRQPIAFLEPMEIQADPEKGVKWPDALGNGSRHPGLLVSERVVADWRDADLRFPEMHLCRVVPPFPKRAGRPPFDYYWVEPQLGPGLDLEASGLMEVGQCSTCGRARFHKGTGVHEKFVFLTGTNSELDVFVSDYSYAAFYCTDRVLRTAGEYGHSNFLFTPADQRLHGEAIDYRKLYARKRLKQEKRPSDDGADTPERRSSKSDSEVRVFPSHGMATQRRGDLTNFLYEELKKRNANFKNEVGAPLLETTWATSVRRGEGEGVYQISFPDRDLTETQRLLQWFFGPADLFMESPETMGVYFPDKAGVMIVFKLDGQKSRIMLPRHPRETL